MSSRPVMQLVPSLSPDGTGSLVLDTCRQLCERIESIVCCLGDRGAGAAELEARHIPVVVLGRQPGFQPAIAKRIAGVIKAHGVEVVHCHRFSPYVHGLLASFMTNVRLVFTEYELSDLDRSVKRRLVTPVLSRLPGQICAASSDLKRRMVAEGFPEQCIRVVHNGIDPGSRPSGSQRHEARVALGLPPDAFVIGTAGRLDPAKNLAVLLQTVALLRDKVKRAAVVIVGDGPQREPLQARAAELGVADSVIFTGERADVRAVMAALDVYLNCSTSEGVSRPMLEAMASALPVVASPVGGNPEIVLDHVTGYLVPSRPRSIVETVVPLAFDARRRSAMGDAARWHVIRHFSIARMVDAYASIYLGNSSCDAATLQPQA